MDFYLFQSSLFRRTLLCTLHQDALTPLYSPLLLQNEWEQAAFCFILTVKCPTSCLERKCFTSRKLIKPFCVACKNRTCVLVVQQPSNRNPFFCSALLWGQHRRRKVLWEIVRPGLRLQPTPERHLQLGPGRDEQQALTESSKSSSGVRTCFKTQPADFPSDLPQQDKTKSVSLIFLPSDCKNGLSVDPSLAHSFLFSRFYWVYGHIFRTLFLIFFFFSLTAWDQLLYHTVIFRPNFDKNSPIFQFRLSFISRDSIFFKLMLKGPVN